MKFTYFVRIIHSLIDSVFEMKEYSTSDQKLSAEKERGDKLLNVLHPVLERRREKLGRFLPELTRNKTEKRHN